MRALYSLSARIAGFDFFTWLVMQRAQGATGVSFDPREPRSNKFARDEILWRYESILKPGCALLDLPYDELGEGQSTIGGQVELLGFMATGRKPERLKSVLPKGRERYTVTLRNTRRWLHRNSNEVVWREFAREIGARVIPDYDVEPIHLHERMALYAGAQMNFFVSNGPVILCFLSDIPAMSFDVCSSPLVRLGIPWGGQYPFLMRDRHVQIYERDTGDVIRKHFYYWRETGRFLRGDAWGEEPRA